MHPLRARFKKDIIAEFLPPASVLRGKKEKSSKIIIFCSGLPGVPSQKALLEFFSKKGFWAITLRYRGTWESGGKFLKISPHQDVLDIVSELPRGIVSLWDHKLYKINPKSIYLFGASFGGPAALLSSKDPRIQKVVVFSPVSDWKAESKKESIDKLARFMKEGFGEAYRPTKDAFRKLKSGNFYNPMTSLSRIAGEKIFIIHAKDDDIVYASSVVKLSKKTGAKLLLLKKGGHFGVRYFSNPRFIRKIFSFIKEAPR